MYYSQNSATISRRTYNAGDRYPWAGAALVTLTLLTMGLVLTFLLGSAMQWRSDVQTQSAAAASQRLTWDQHDPAIARNIQVGALR